MTHLKQDTEHRDVLTRMMRLAEKSEENAAETLKQLHDQGQALDRIQQTSADIEVEAARHKKLSRQIYSFWYYLKDRFVSKGKANEETKLEKQSEKPNIDIEQPQQKVEVNAGSEECGQEEALSILIEKTRAAKNMNKQIGLVVPEHTKRIENITAKNEKTQSTLEQSNKMLKKKLG